MNGNITTAPLGGNRNIKTKPLYQYDYGQVLRIVGVTLPAAYEVHFSNQLHGVATTQIGNADGVIIPDIYLTTGEPVYAWIYLHTGNSDGETEYTITIPVVRRASISDAEPTPVQQDAITQAIAALNTAVEQTAQDVQDATEAKQDAEEAAGNAYESAVAAAQSAANAGTYAGQAQSAQAASELAQQKAEEAQTGAQTAKWAAESAQTAAEAAQAGAVAARTGAETAQAGAVAARSGAETAQYAAEAARDEITGLSATANTLPAGSQATASYSDGLLTIGVPKGEKGSTGDTGATPDLTIGTVSTLPAGSSATASITGTPEEPVLNLGIPKGDQGEVSQAEFDALSDDVSDMQDTLEHKADIDGYYTDMTVGAAEQVVSSTMYEDNAPYKLRTSGGSTDIGNRAYVDKIVGGTVAWNQQVRDEASENVTEYADVVTVTDAVEDDAAVKVAVEPVQDLHGYDAPWPAGGGANKWDEETELGTLSTVDGSEIASSAIIRTKSYVPVESDKSYYVVCSDQMWMVFFDENKNIITTDLPSGAGAASNARNYRNGWIMTPPTNCKYVRWYFRIEYGAIYKHDTALNYPSTVITYSPYSNICPISGWDEVNVWDDPRYGGLIKWNQYYNQAIVPTSQTVNGITLSKDSDGWISVSGTATADVTLQLVGALSVAVGHKMLIFGCPSGGTYNTYNISTSGYSEYGNGLIVENTSNVRYVWIRIANGYTANALLFKPQLFDLTAMFGAGNEPTTVEEFRALFPNDFYSYNAGQTMTVGQVNGEAYRHYTIALPTEAGTVYGGVLTVNKDGTGSLVVDRAEADLGTLNWRFTSNRANTNDLDGIAKPPVSASATSGSIAEQYKEVAATNNLTDGTYALLQQQKLLLLFYYDRVNPPTGKLVFPLLNPQTYSLTATQVQTLLGTNHVWSDAGQLSLTYTGTDEHLVLTTGRKYLTRINGTDSMVLGAGQSLTAVKGRDNVFDLTQMFGTAVADYVYQQGAGYFRRWFGGSHYAYNAGELISVQGVQSRDVVGFNQWDEEWENGIYNNTTGEPVGSSNAIRSKNALPVIPNEQYYIIVPYNTTVAGFAAILFYDANDVYTGTVISASSNGYVFTAPTNAYYARFYVSLSYGTTYNHDICINLSHNTSRNGEYEPYTHRSYPLDSTLTLRGIPKVDSNGVYWDGDEYGYDGAVKRRYGVLACDGTIDYSTPSIIGDYSRIQVNFTGGTGKSTYPQALSSWLDMVVHYSLESDHFYCNSAGAVIIINTSKVGTTSASVKAYFSTHPLIIVYELATPTAEAAQPYQHIQSVDDWGTEEFVSGTITPVGHQSRYPQNLRDKLQHLPALASANGSYLITQTNGQMVLSPFPTPPTAAGNYMLNATVSGGNATYSWVAQ